MYANFRVGQYILERPLGEGGMAEVWLARNVHLGTPVAIKFLNQSFAGSNEVEQRFLNEGKRQGGLNHPNIIKVYGFEYVGNRSFLILQFIDGESVEERLHRLGRLAPEEALRIGISVLNALDCAHEHNIVHRDLKPSNILLDANGFPYLGDFGIVLATNEKRLTRTGTAMGTALYMSPEQIRSPGSVDRRSDIYSFGCVLYEMLSGMPPFNPQSTGQGDTDFAVKLAHVQQQPPPLRQRNPSLSPQLEAVVMRCLAKDPGARYNTCRELRDALSAAAISRPLPPPLGPPPLGPLPLGPPPLGPPPVYMQAQSLPKRRGWLVALAISAGVLLLVALAAGFNALQTEQREKQQREQQEHERQLQAEKERSDREAEEREVEQSKAANQTFEAAEERLRADLNGQYYSISFKNGCAKGPITIAATYKDLEGDWVTTGWWTVQPLATTNPAMYSKNRIFYFYAHNDAQQLFWSGQNKPDAVEEQVADNVFVHRDNEPALGHNKRTLKLFKREFDTDFGLHEQSFSCE